jgi:CRP-like cAMP-binding protein/ferredoxin
MSGQTIQMSTIQLTIDGQTVTVPSGTTIYDAARMNGIAIPTLCHLQNETPVGVCRVCVVDVGQRVYAAACVRQADQGMVVKTKTDPVLAARRTLVELLLSDHPSPCARQQNTGDCEVEILGRDLGLERPRFPRRTAPRPRDDSSFAILVDHDACILCDRCTRGCSEIRRNFVLARTGKGYAAGIAFDNNLPMGTSSCVSCGECMVSCPTGALTNKGVVGQRIGHGTPVDTEELQLLPVFRGVSGTFLELNKGAVVERRFKAGEIVCREGEFGSTAFYILHGTAEVFIHTPIAHVATEGSSQGWLSRLRSKLVRRHEHQREEEVTDRRWIPIDGPVDLAYDSPVAELGAGDLFGEMSCLNFYPRSATVRARTDCVMLEMLRNVLDILQKNKTFKAQLEQNYRQRALATHLQSVPLLSPLNPEFISYLRDHAELVRYAPGQVICRQGEPADSFYLIHIGFVKVSQTYPGGELVLAYLSRGNYFGEIGLLGSGERSATCTAVDHVEVVRISAEDFRLMLDSFPEVRLKLHGTAQERLIENQRILSNVRSVPVEQFLTQGLIEAQNLLVVDLTRCTRCDHCVRACADAHDGITRLIRDGIRFDKYLIATSCRQCRDPRCMVGCPVGSIRRRNSLEIIIEDWCIGCGLCASNCPYGNITLHPFETEVPDPDRPGFQKAVVSQKATSCDLCHDHAEPTCVYACPHGAAQRVDPREFFARLRGEQESRS